MKLTREELEKYVRDAYGEPLRDATHDFFNELMPGSNRVVCTQNIADAAKTLIRTIIDAAIGRFDALTDSTGGGEKETPTHLAVETAIEQSRDKSKTWEQAAKESKISGYEDKPRDNSEWNAAIEAAAKLVDYMHGKLLEPRYIAGLIRSLHRPEAEKSAKNQADGEDDRRGSSQQAVATGTSDAPSPSALEEREYEVKVEESNSILQGRHGIVFDRALADERNAASKLIETLKRRIIELEGVTRGNA